MLINLRTLHNPTTRDEAVMLLNKPGVKPLYGGALVRENAKETEEAVDLSALGLNRVQVEGDILVIGSTTTLETVREFCLTINSVIAAALAEIIRAEYPLTLRNVMTPGDVITEARGNSLLLTFFAAIGNRASLEKQGNLIIARRVMLDTPDQDCGFSFEKVARTPADAPIVGAVAWVEGAQERVAVCGLMQAPAVYTFGMPSQIADYLGSAEYRTEMAKIVARRALERATAMAGQLGQ